MYPATLIQWCRAATAAPGSNFAEMVQPIQLVDGVGSTSVPGAIIGSGFSQFYAVTGGPAVMTLYVDGTENSGLWNWWSPPTAGKGAMYWAELVAISGTGTMSGSPLSTRLRIDSAPSWSLDTSNRIRDFTLNFYDAASGGSLVSTGTIELDTRL